ncbi:probable calcium-binding protein CML27 [Arachis stenosperma]|uniref:probable calcium-binding protein CML27 n=1 Tax=Arachis stenosperma TaxID=217475 RepID=UPI0025AC9403|nr:probable calcium-binding protein CML27 [Arachis stenosperma]
MIVGIDNGSKELSVLTMEAEDVCFLKGEWCIIPNKEFADFSCTGTVADMSKELRDVFDLYDLDKNGLISVMELHTVLKHLGKKCSLSDRRCMIKNVDSDGDGNINFEEFKKMMARS